MNGNDLVRSLRKDTGAAAAAIVSRDGLVLEADLPPEVSQETFSIMCAAIMGAAMTATNEMGRASPTRIDLRSEDVRIRIYAAGRKAMLVLVLDPDIDVEAADRRVEAAREQVAQVP